MNKSSISNPTPPSENVANLQALIGLQTKPSWLKRPLLWAILLGLMVIGVIAYFWQRQQVAAQAPSYVTEEVKKGDLALTISANGTLQPTRSVEVGSELSGTVKAVLVDVNDRVKKGQVLVELDVTKLKNQVQSAIAALASAQAQVQQANATLQEASLNLQRMEQVHQLSGGKTPAKTELDSARAEQTRAKAALASAVADVEQAKASLSNDQTNLTKAYIRSPIDGVVLSRSVDPGNAVAASLQAVTLFTLAEDLKQLRLEANVDEADVGTVQAGQKASFTVSSYPTRRYPATIFRVAYGATTTDNVITYTAYLDVDNADLTLRPGMTASASITSSERHNVLLVPNTALRFTPQTAQNISEKTTQGGSSIVSSLMPRPPNNTPSRPKTKDDANTNQTAKGTRQVWVLDKANNPSQGMPSVKPVSVKLGISNGRYTEVLDGDLKAGMQIITDQQSKATK